MNWREQLWTESEGQGWYCPLLPQKKILINGRKATNASTCLTCPVLLAHDQPSASRLQPPLPSTCLCPGRNIFWHLQVWVCVANPPPFLPAYSYLIDLIDQTEAWPGTYWVSTCTEGTRRSAGLQSCAGRNISAGTQGAEQGEVTKLPPDLLLWGSHPLLVASEFIV